MTFHDNINHWGKPTEKKIIYSGVRARNPVMPGGFYHGRSPLTLTLYIYFGTIDVVLSLGMDTVLLPATIPMAISDSNRESLYQCLCYKERAQANNCFSYSKCGKADLAYQVDVRDCNNPDYPVNQCVLRYR